MLFVLKSIVRASVRGDNPRPLASGSSPVHMCGPHSKQLIAQTFYALILHLVHLYEIFGPRQANLVLIAYASSEGSGEPAHPRSLARTSAARSYKQ